MPDFDPLPIILGCGDIHLNRFRLMFNCDKPEIASRLGANLLSNFPKYLTERTASVKTDAHTWQGQPVLTFTGVAKVRPFGDMFTNEYLADIANVAVPDRLRDWMIPDVHKDSVGIISRDATGFTVQTLKRRFDDGTDHVLRDIIGGLSTTISVIPKMFMVGRRLRETLVRHLIELNQSHFLAGRRSFRIISAKNVNIDSPMYFFETSAIERFSDSIYEKGEFVTGSFTPVIKRIWTDMLHQFCRVEGFRSVRMPDCPGWFSDGQLTHYIQRELPPSAASVHADYHWKEMSALHPAIFDW